MWYSEIYGVIKTPREITHNGVSHPRQIFRKWSNPELAELGIRPASVVVPDGRYYYTGIESYTLVGDEWVISYEEKERDVGELKRELLIRVKANVGLLLKHSDWRVVREIDGGTPLTDAWKTYRNEVRTHGNSLESGVESFASLQAVKNFQNHAVVEVRYESTYDAEGNETIGPETKDYNRTVDKTYWGWPTAPDAIVDPYHKEYK
tara:strand:- start:714 stop:1331 length:618 start_codon:yes stop_codon:yes gene_type:complete